MPAIQTGHGVITIRASAAPVVGEEAAVNGALSHPITATGPAPEVIQHPTTTTQDAAPVEEAK
jgi:hypothetical protein